MSVHVERSDGIALLTLDQPDRRNSFDQAMAVALRDAVRALASDLPRVLVLRSAGEHFSVGGDVRYFQQLLQAPRALRDEGVARLVGSVNEAVLALTELPCPVLGLLDGAVAGFGLSLALACDLLIASEDTRLIFAYGGIGITPDGGGSWHLPRHVGLHRALALALLNRPLSAHQAHAWGVLAEVVERERLQAAGLVMARDLAAGSATAQAATKRLLRSALGRDLASSLDAERALFVALAAGDDFAEGVDAFCQRRPASFNS
ncbi:enoyl-CoA hydratase-related protein [Pseudomonas sp. GD03858]|uniref:enoyl-CoA hydratase/isomerase family protein n=1 Tax=unclassified Pseudomonas TaxID=196821 RepID=UPI002448E1C3|nr:MULTISPECIES: enoyl-CoA hydratase-related protein [unclassified Pseudomonas]MDH0646966.1 enoyl-CoA hydratase-related protein [Pseudomonas sp. GD03867]MDH0662691.1 enoyl-CoA hydratase-related protein [Pseudomonas sp. GD03858]